MANIGYVRVSSIAQNTQRQLDGMKLDKVFMDKQSGKSVFDRTQLQLCIDYSRQGDTLNIHSIDRLARNLIDLQAIIKVLNDKGVTVKFYKENLTFNADGLNPINKLMFQLLGAFAEFERNIIRERQAEGIAKALKNGTKFGAAPKFNELQIQEIKSRRSNGESVIALSKSFNVSRQTIYTILKNSK